MAGPRCGGYDERGHEAGQPRGWQRPVRDHNDGYTGSCRSLLPAHIVVLKRNTPRGGVCWSPSGTSGRHWEAGLLSHTPRTHHLLSLRNACSLSRTNSAQLGCFYKPCGGRGPKLAARLLRWLPRATSGASSGIICRYNRCCQGQLTGGAATPPPPPPPPSPHPRLQHTTLRE